MKTGRIIEDAYDLLHDCWAVVTVGTIDEFNSMTVAWGSFGALWVKPVIIIFIKPNRYTFEFLEKAKCFSLSFFGKEYKDDLIILGTKSGRDGDKVSETRLTPTAIDKSFIYYNEEGNYIQTAYKGVIYKEADITYICKKIYYQDIDRQRVPEEIVNRYYRTEAPHRMYVGEIVGVIEHNEY